MPSRDAGVPDEPDATVDGPDASGGGTGTVVFRLAAREEEPSGEWSLESAYVELADLRADNDRGGALEPMWEGPGRVRLDENPVERRVEGVPATYGGVTLRAPDSGGPTFELTFREGDTRVRVESRRAYEVSLRCDAGGVSLRPAGEVTLSAELDVAGLVEVLDSEELPEPSEEGEVEVDESSDPELLGRFEDAFDERWHLDCGGG